MQAFANTSAVVAERRSWQQLEDADFAARVDALWREEAVKAAFQAEYKDAAPVELQHIERLLGDTRKVLQELARGIGEIHYWALHALNPGQSQFAVLLWAHCLFAQDWPS
jgi:hypothetical protein